MQKASLLIIEDNVELSSRLRSHFQRYFQVSQVPTVQATLTACEHGSFDVVLLDRTLPDGDGSELVGFFTSQFPYTKVCIMSNQGDWQDRLYGLNLGADSYLPKPFHPQEALALLLALLRRGQCIQGKVLKKGELELNVEGNFLRKGPHLLNLTPREMELLELFFQQPSNYVTSEQIRNWFWQRGREVSSSYLHVYAQRLRKKLKRIQGTIVAHYGTGYELKTLE